MYVQDTVRRLARVQHHRTRHRRLDDHAPVHTQLCTQGIVASCNDNVANSHVAERISETGDITDRGLQRTVVTGNMLHRVNCDKRFGVRCSNSGQPAGCEEEKGNVERQAVPHLGAGLLASRRPNKHVRKRVPHQQQRCHRASCYQKMVKKMRSELPLCCWKEACWL